MAKGFVEQRLSKENRLLLYLTPKGDQEVKKVRKSEGRGL
jgi:hypothetical protein